MVLELLYNEVVRTLLSVVVIPLAVILLTLGLIAFLTLITQGRRDVEQLESFKFMRYESGNPMKGEARRSLSMQYFGYLVLFLALEPALILVALTLLASPDNIPRLLLTYLILIIVFTPLLVYGVRESRRVEGWLLD